MADTVVVESNPPEPKKLKVTIWTNADLVSDTGWVYAPSARPDRGLHDYQRTLVFNQPLASWEENRISQALKDHDNPGYVWWSMTHQGNGSYLLKTTMDSSD